MKEMIEAFILVFAIGGLISWAAWHFTRRLAERAWWWRAILCVLFAATVVPTCFHLFGGLVVCPAVVLILELKKENEDDMKNKNGGQLALPAA